jgi:hypothetical protein
LAGRVLLKVCFGTKGDIMMQAKKAIGILLLLIFTNASRFTAEEKQSKPANLDTDVRALQREPSYRGEPLSYWLDAIRRRDENSLSLAFEAIRSLGPEAASAVPDLTRVVAGPFTPIDLGKDSDEVIMDKLFDIEVRSEAVVALACIGEAASTATTPIIEWALSLRVVPPAASNHKYDERFLELVTLEVEYRIAVIHAVRKLGDPAFPIVARMLKSSDTEERKFAVMILGTEALPIVEALLKSHDCEASQLGITILKDMEPLADKKYLDRLRRMIVCSAD